MSIPSSQLADSRLAGEALENRCAMIVPVYNEAGAIVATVEKIKKITSTIPDWEFEIICVDDGSKDATASLLGALSGIRVVSHQVNRGYGAALRTGIRTSTSPWLVICDADETYPIEELPSLLKEVLGGYDMVVGARKGIGIHSDPFHRIARWILRKMAHALSGTMVPDLNSGFRVFRRTLYEDCATLLPSGFSFTTTITMSALYSGYKTRFIPIEYKKRIGKSNIKPVRDFLGFSMLILRVASYFEPLRFFLPVSYVTILIGVAKGTRDFWYYGHIGSLAIIFVFFGIQIFMTGIVAEVVVRRSATPRGR